MNSDEKNWGYQNKFIAHIDNDHKISFFICRDFPDYKAYETPCVFTSDWLNEFWDSKADNDDYRFVYMGPKGSW